MKAYNINNNIVFTTDSYDLQYLIEERNFSADEMKYPKIQAGRIVVDTVAKTQADTIKLNQLYGTKYQAIKAQEEVRIKQGFTYTLNGVLTRFNADDKGQRFLNGLATMVVANILTTDFGPFTAYDNTDVTIPHADIIPLGVACVQYIQSVHAWKRTKEAALDALYAANNIVGMEAFDPGA